MLTAYARLPEITGAVKPTPHSASTGGGPARPRIQPTVPMLVGVIWVAVVLARLAEASWSACGQSPVGPDAAATPNGRTSAAAAAAAIQRARNLDILPTSVGGLPGGVDVPARPTECDRRVTVCTAVALPDRVRARSGSAGSPAGQAVEV